MRSAGDGGGGSDDARTRGKACAVGALLHNNRLSQPALRGTAVGVDEELHESELERGGAVAKRALDRVPQRHVPVHHRHHADAKQTLARPAAVPDERG